MRFLATIAFPVALLSAQQTAADLVRQAFEARNAGQLERSISLYELALTLRPDDPESWWYQGLNFYDLDRFRECEDAFLKVVEQAPENGGGYAFAGLCEFQNKKYETAFAHLVFAKQKGLPPGEDLAKVVHYHYVMLANKIGQFELASGLLADTARNPLFDVPDLVELTGLSALRMELLPSEIPEEMREPVLMAGRATILAWRRRIAEALQQVDALLKKYPRQPNAHYLKGYILLLDHSEKAIGEFEKELEVSPDHVQARLQIAHEYLQRGEAAKGLPYAERAVQLAPSDFTAHNFLGRILLDLDKVELALAHLQTAVKLAPASPDAHFHLAAALARAGRSQEAAKHRGIFKKLDEARRAQRSVTLPAEAAR